MMASAAAAGPYALAAVAVLNALGAFRSNKTVGGGITGTLGGSDLQAYDLNRRGGTMFNGPSYSLRNEGPTAQTQALNNAFVAIRTGTTQMAKDLGLATAQVENFTMSVGDVKVHPDINKLGLALDGLTDQQKLAKIEEVLQKSGNAMAELVLGAGATSQQLAQLYASVMQQRAGLEMQLLQAQGNITEIRKRERDALHESNRAIYDQIKALEDQKTAAEEAARAAEEVSRIYASALAEAGSALDAAIGKQASAQAAIDNIRERGTQNYLNALQRVKDLQSQAAEAQMNSLREYIVISKDLRGFVAAQTTQPTTQFSNALTKAMSGDKEAMRSLTSLAGGAVDATRSAATTATEARLQQARIMAQIREAAEEAEKRGQGAAEKDPQAEMQANLLAAQQELAAATVVANAINAPLAAKSDRLIDSYQAALKELSEARSEANSMLAVLMDIRTSMLQNNESMSGLLRSLTNGFDNLDANQDGLLTSYEFFMGMAGKATDKELKDLWQMLDNNGNGQLTKLEAIVANTAVIAKNIGQGTAGAITASTNEMTQAAFTSALQAEALKQGLSSSAVTSSFSGGLFSQLDVNKSGGLSSSEASASTITSAISNLLASTTAAAQASTLTAKDVEILARPGLQAITSPSGEAGNAVYKLFGQYLGRRPERQGYDYWVEQYEAIKKARGSAAAYAEIEVPIKDTLRQLGGTVTGVKSAVEEYYIGLGGTKAGGQELIKRLFFATGAAFTNSVVSRPTAFNMGVMGEAGPEAIMPLSNVGGSLGVRAQMPGTQGMLQALQTMQALMQRLQAASENGALTSQEHLNLVRRLTRDGRAMPVAPSPNDPLTVEITP
jgi:hypothetical protein